MASSSTMMVMMIAMTPSLNASSRVLVMRRSPVAIMDHGEAFVHQGAVWLRHYLPLDEQRELAGRYRAIMDGPDGGYVPTVRGGGKMHVRMVCLGRHWNPLTYSYEATRADHDDAPVAPLPEELAALASRIAADGGFHDFRPDIGLINLHDPD